MKTGEWDGLLGLLAFFGLLLLLGSGLRCEVQVDSGPADAGADPWGAVRNQPNGSACPCETPSGMRIVGQGVDPL